MNWKIKRIINAFLNSKVKERKEKNIDEQNILNYKITKFNKKADNNKYSGIKDSKTDYTNFNDFTFKEKKMKSTRNNNNNILKYIWYCYLCLQDMISYYFIETY